MADNKRVQPDAIEAAFAASSAPRMKGHEIVWMLTAAIRIPAVMTVARTHITRQLFDTSEAAFSLLWTAASSAATECGGALPTDPHVARELVALRCSTELANDPGRMYYTASVQRMVMGEQGILDDIEAFKVSPEIENVAFQLIARFLRERMLSDPIRRALAGIGPHDVIGDPETVISVIENKARELVGLSNDPGSAAVVKGFVPVGRKAVTTKMNFMDRLMGGGHAPSEAYCVLGPSSGGKSALMVQLALEAAELEAAVANELGEERARNWYYFTWELTEAQLRTRVYAYGAKISFDSMKAFANNGVPYSTSANPETLKEYESDPYVNSPGNPVMGETERLEAFERRCTGLGANLRIIDYSGDKSGHGSGGVDEVASYIKREIAAGQRVAGVVLDYAGLTVDRYVSAKNMNPDAVYSLLASFGNMVRSKIAIPFACKTWVLHQLKGDAARKRYGKLHYSDARGCRNFADNFDFGIEFQKYNEATGLVEFSASKHRHAAGLSDGVVARFDGRFGAFLDPDQEYVKDPSSGRLVPRAFLDRVVSVPTSRGPKKPLNPMDGLS